MKIKFLTSCFMFLSVLLISTTGSSKDHPCLLLTKNGVQRMRLELKGSTLFHTSLEVTKQKMDATLAQPMFVPIPKDAGGGYTHERHKKNYNEMQQMGILYQLYQDDKYAVFVKNMLMEYAKMYAALPLHPVQKSDYRGKLFWQGLNECVWLVHAAQAYDCIYDYLSSKDRDYIEKNLFLPMVKFIAEDNKATFNKIHNHGTWAVSAVGMIAYVMDNTDLVQKSLYGLEKDGKGGFMRQLDELFSPDGYFNEGPYYQRYSLQPFVIFGQVIQNNDPQQKIFEYRDHVLEKAVVTLLQMADANGSLFLLNDALYKTWRNTELVYGTDIVYNISKDKSLLSIAKDQNKVILTEAGLAVAKDLQKGEAKPFVQKTILIRDGADGSKGGLGILRLDDGENQTTVLMKATSQGMGHGHFDKLTISLYDHGKEILTDYGAARYVNIEAKNGGHYLSENNTWAKQTIAHNTLVVDEMSNYGGILSVAENYAPNITAFVDKKTYKEVSASEAHAYPGVNMERRVIMVKPEGSKEPLIIDVFKILSDTEHQYDLSYYYSGQIMSLRYDNEVFTQSRKPLGTVNGYQYLWQEAVGKSQNNTASMTFLSGSRFYTITSLTNPEMTLHLNRVGANDPNFNLRNEPSFMLRDKTKAKVFLTVIEPHGQFNADAESTSSSTSDIKNICFIDTDKTQIEIHKTNGSVIKVDTKNKTCVLSSAQ